MAFHLLGLDSNQVEPCCWKTYTKHRTTEETLATLDRLNIDVDRTPKEDLVIKFGIDSHSYRNGRLPLFKRIQPVVWQLFEEPRSSNAAMVIAAIQISMIVLSVAILWISSYSPYNYEIVEMKSMVTTRHNTITNQKITKFRLLNRHGFTYLQVFEYITMAWFIIDLTVRLVVSPNKHDYFHKFDNIIDIIATIWLVIDSILQIYIDSFLLKSIQVVRVLRLFRLLTYHPGLQVIITSIKTSAAVLQLLVFFIIVSSTIYGAVVFYAERLTTDNPDSNLFISVPDAFWYAIVSLTTIGYGELSPTTTLGRLFGGACVVTGVLMVGLPMTIVVEIFTNFYNHLRARSKLPKQRRRILPVEAPRLRKKTAGTGGNSAAQHAL